MSNPFPAVVPTNPFAALNQGPPTQPVKTFYGTIPDGAATDVNSLFAALLEFKWRDVSFPVTHFDTELRQDLVVHKFADRDSAHIEAMGRHPLQITARIPFVNGLAQGPNEHWQRPLYPTNWRQFLSACADRSSGTLQHPELGDITCKLSTMRTSWDANARAGVFVDVTWIESDDTANDLVSDLDTRSPVASVSAAAADLDFQVAQINPSVVPAPYIPKTSFTDRANAIRGTVDQATLLQKAYGGQVDNMIYEVKALEDSLARVSNSLNWPMVQACETMKDACYTLKTMLLAKNRAISLYTVPKDSTMAEISASSNATITDLIILNGSLVVSPVVPQGTQVRVYV